MRAKTKTSTPKSITLIILAAIIFISACSQGGIKNTNYHTGSKGITAEFIKDYPPDEVYENEPMPVLIELKNKGAHDTPYDRIMLSFAYDPLYLTGVNQFFMSDNGPEGIFRGRSFYYPEGEEKTLEFYDFQTRSIVGLRESPETQLTAQLCYEYETDYVENVCVDVDQFLRSGREQVCHETKGVTAGTQGAPVAFKSIEIHNTPIRTDSGLTVRPDFIVTLENVGDGIVIGPPKDDFVKACSIKGLSTGEINSVLVSGSIFGINLECSPELVRLSDGTGETRCTIPDDQLNNPALAVNQNFYTALSLKAKYIYRSSLVKKIELKRLPGNEPSMERFEKHEPAKVPGYAYDKEGKQVTEESKQVIGGFNIVTKLSGVKGTIKEENGELIIQLPAEARGRVIISPEAQPGLMTQIKVSASDNKGIITATTEKGDVIFTATADEGLGATMGVDGSKLIIGVSATTGGSIRVSVDATKLRTEEIVSSEENPPSEEKPKVVLEKRISTTKTGGTLEVAIIKKEEKPVGMSYCEYFAKNPENIDNSDLNDKVKETAKKFINEDFDCVCTRSECDKLDDEGKCIRGLCPGATYCCDKREEQALSYEETKDTYTVRSTVYYLPDCEDFPKWSYTEAKSSTEACKLNNKGFYEAVLCEGGGYCGQKTYNYRSIAPVKEKSSIGPIKTACGVTPVERKTIAVNNKPGTECYIPLGSKVELYFGPNNPWNGIYYAQDTGSMIKGCHIDVFAGHGKSKLSEAMRYASKDSATLKVLEYGSGTC